MSAGLHIAEGNGVARLTLSRPERLNALNRPLVDAIRDYFTALYWRRDIRVVTLGAEGRHFCAGFDLKENGDAPGDTVDEKLDGQRMISEIVIAMRRCPQPVVAIVNGAASGGGMALALAADIRLGTPDMRMNAAFIRIGLSACDIGVSYFLPRMIGSSVAAHYMLTGRFIDADAAVRHGLVSCIGSLESLQAESETIVADMLRATPLGLRLTKEALSHAIDAASLEAVIAMEDRNQILCAQGPHFSEGIASFIEKREPDYRAR